MSKFELTKEQKDFRLEPSTLNKQMVYWISKARSMCSLMEANKRYNELRKTKDHGTAFEELKRQFFKEGLKDD